MTNNHTFSYLLQTLMQWNRHLISFLPNLIMAIIVLALSYFIAKYVRSGIRRIYKRTSKMQNHSNHDLTKVNFISSIIFFIILLSGIFTAFDILDLTSILAGAGILGIIAGFALKGIVSNLFSGVLIKIWAPYHEGDWVNISDQVGCIYKIGYAVTQIKTLEYTILNVPNSLIYENISTNYSAVKKMRVKLEVGVSYGDDLDLVKKTAIDTVNSQKFTIDHHKTKFYFLNIGSSTYNFETWSWIKFHNINDYYEARSELIMAIKRSFEEQSISIAYNVMTLDFGVKGGVNLFDKEINISKK
ncbi:MAG: mechanosensitive ion channel [Psittacicella sp.]